MALFEAECDATAICLIAQIKIQVHSFILWHLFFFFERPHLKNLEKEDLLWTKYQAKSCPVSHFRGVCFCIAVWPGKKCNFGPMGYYIYFLQQYLEWQLGKDRQTRLCCTILGACHHVCFLENYCIQLNSRITGLQSQCWGHFQVSGSGSGQQETGIHNMFFLLTMFIFILITYFYILLL